MDQQKQKLLERIKQAQNILVTVSANPTVDQLSAAIGLTLALNKMDKHGTAVFSGQVPSTIEFLKPEDTLEKNTDSLRDFIIALDKSKADKLRYKVEDQVVRIFITPYKTSLSEKDLDFSQGDFNVDVVIALGVTEQTELDTAITAHGRILHDATVACLSIGGQGSLGTINWVDPSSSSLSEMAAALTDGLDKKLMDNQIATAFLTGIVASTERFRNDRTSPRTMSVSALLMAAGANQQLIASELEAPVVEPVAPTSPYEEAPAPNEEPAPAPPKPEPGVLEIEHDDLLPPVGELEEEPQQPEQPQIHVDEDGKFINEDSEDVGPEISRVRGVASDGTPSASAPSEVTHERLDTLPLLGDTGMTANSEPEALDPPTEELTLPAVDAPLLTHNASVLPPTSEPVKPVNAPAFIPQQPLPAPLPPVAPQPAMTLPPMPAFEPPAFTAPTPAPFTPPAPAPMPSFVSPALPSDNSTLSEIERSVASPHVQEAQLPVANVDSARNAVEAAFSTPAAQAVPTAISALNAQPLGGALHEQIPAPAPVSQPAAAMNTGFSEPTPGNTPADDALDMPMPSNPFGPGQQAFVPPAQPAPTSAFPGVSPSGTLNGQTPPPPVPPPMLPPLQ
jgi:hypothetical protein